MRMRCGPDATCFLIKTYKSRGLIATVLPRDFTNLTAKSERILISKGSKFAIYKYLTATLQRIMISKVS